MLRFHILAINFAFSTSLFAAPLPEPSQQLVDFSRDIAPILQQHCLKCHQDGKSKGGLRLDARAELLKGGNSGVVVQLGQSGKSRLIQVIAGVNPDEVMPPEGEKLTSQQISLMRAWIDQGMKWGELKTIKPTQAGKHWAFEPVKAPKIPDGEASHPIDRFIQVRLEKEKLLTNPEATPETLIRRLYLDLIGLPPTSAEVDQFKSDASATNYEQLVDCLLADPHFGERWGRHWLDAARYADSDGYEKDLPRPYAWRYRDWVINAINRDLPYDQFVIEQLAGDLLPNANQEQKIATGFHRNTLTNKEGGVDQEEFRVAAVMDRVATTGKVFLGATIACAQCHDHKYDPFSQREYYQLFAFFNRDKETELDLAPPPLPRLSIPPKKTVVDAYSKAPVLTLGPDRKSHILIKGDFLRPGVEVQPGMPVSLGGNAAAATTRLDLARWIASNENPLTRRVFVNQVWSKLFGRGLVFTLDDFGTQGEKPSHPELLDFLATEFAQDGWSLKRLIRGIVTSSTYKQSSQIRPDHLERDPRNILLARQSRIRLESEILRDQALAVSGQLFESFGGPPIKPPQPPGISELTYASHLKWVETTGIDRNRRGVYIWLQRTSPYPSLMTFDSPDSNVCTVRRDRSNTPLQALTLLNDVVFQECAQTWGLKLAQRSKDVSATLAEAFRSLVGRELSSSEQERLMQLFVRFKTLYAAKPDQAKTLLGKSMNKVSDPTTSAAWIATARTLLNLDEFLNRE
jgi:mono/diheme cytochrome c family protein